MGHLIDKDKIVAEIERIYNETNYEPFTNEVFGKRIVCKKILDFLDAVEPKEVNLEKEVDIENAVHGTIDYPLIGCDFPNIYPNYKEFKEYCDRKAIKDNDKVKLIIIKDM